MYKYLVLLSCSYWTFTASAQLKPFVNYTVRDGLLSNYILNVFQDSRGKIYFMTHNGISVYDGARFINYTKDDGLPDNMVNDIYEVTPDSLLLATNAKQLSALVRGKIKPVHSPDEYPVINKFMGSADGQIYLGCDNGLYLLAGSRFKPIQNGMNPEELKSIEELIDAGDYLLVKRYQNMYNSQTLLVVNKKTGAVKKKLSGSLIYILPLRSRNLVLLVIDTKEPICWKFTDLEKGVITQEKTPTEFRFINRERVKYMCTDRNGVLWAVATSAVQRIDTSGETHTIHSLNTINLFPKLFVDNENTSWFYTKGNGVFKMGNPQLSIVNDLFAGGNFMVTDFLASSASDSVWAFDLFQQRLFCYEEDRCRNWKTPIGQPVSSILRINRGVLLCTGSEIYKMGFRNGSLSPPTRFYSIRTKEPSTGKAVQDAAGNIYISGKNIEVVTPAGEGSLFPMPDFADEVCFDQGGLLWVITRSNTVQAFKPTLQNGKMVLKKTGDFSGKLTINAPRTISFDASGLLWIGTRFDGLFGYDVSRNLPELVYHLTNSDGLSDNFIRKLYCEGKNIWVGTQSGLDQVFIKNGQPVIRNITAGSNLFIPIQKLGVDRSGNAWFMGEYNLGVVEDLAVNSSYQPKLQLSRISSAALVYGILPERFRFPAGTTQLNFEVAAPSSVMEKSISYCYQLTGASTAGWSECTSNPSFNFINLLPGEYTLRVKAYFPALEAKNQELAYSFSILPFWWQTWWFKSLAAFLLLVVVASAVRFYFRQKLAKQKTEFEKLKAIEQERTRISMEIHDDLGSGLTSIRYLANTLAAEPETVPEKASKIVVSANELVENMNDIIWTIKTDNNTLSETISYIRKQSAEQLEIAGVNYRFTIPAIPDVNLSSEQKRNLLLIAKEAVHNIIKHSHATETDITAQVKKNKLILKISDNGIGLRNETGNFGGNGLKNLKIHTEDLGGLMEIFNETGTTLKFTIPLA